MRSDDLRKWVKSYTVGSSLFAQDDAGETIYLIKSGKVQLFRRSHDTQKLVGTVGAGGLLGEKTLFANSAYSHSVTAKAIEPTQVIQFEASELPIIEKKFPEFKMRLLASVTGRLEQANQLIRILQTPGLKDRVIQYVLYYCEHNQGQEGTEIVSTMIEADLQIPADTVKEYLNYLVEHKALTLADERYFLAHLGLLRQLTLK